MENLNMEDEIMRKWLVFVTLIMLIALVFATGTMNMSADEDDEEDDENPFRTIWDELEDIQEQLDNEIAARELADDALQAAIDAEALARITEDNGLEDDIDDEEIARIADVNGIQGQIDNLDSRISALEPA